MKKQISVCLLACVVTCLFAGRAVAVTYTISGTSYSVTSPSESVIAPFTSSVGAATVNPYSGLVLISVSGIGASLGSTLGDAFYYNFGAPVHNASYYQLVVTTDASVALNTTDNAYQNIVYDVDAGIEVTPAYTPAYRADHTYNFILDLSTQSPPTPSILRFGVDDGNFGDNSGEFRVAVSQLEAAPASVPDGGTTLALMSVGLIGVFGAKRRLTRA